MLKIQKMKIKPKFLQEPHIDFYQASVFLEEKLQKTINIEIKLDARFKHSKEWIHYDNKDWEKVVWSDETVIDIFASDGIFSCTVR
ncbi:hypothetical protein H312_00001 [Anncaliia algerae PRA339]|uniref:Uncharacterized protein n=1 Tax=Anncaliia algerae PRA339 TaxID=1288291 RepID=A0A059F4X6_9MICR|nr:hypothetical protein H312_00001 [Anncaliia algerae PRA339]